MECTNCGGPLSKSVESKCWYCGIGIPIRAFHINDATVYSNNEEAALKQYANSAKQFDDGYFHSIITPLDDYNTLFAPRQFYPSKLVDRMSAAMKLATAKQMEAELKSIRDQILGT